MRNVRSSDKSRGSRWLWSATIIISVAFVCTTYFGIILKTEIADGIIMRRRQVEYLNKQVEKFLKELHRTQEELDRRDLVIKDLERQVEFYRQFLRSTNAYLSENPK